jgi:hypothetical protein
MLRSERSAMTALAVCSVACEEGWAERLRFGEVRLQVCGHGRNVVLRAVRGSSG